MPASISMEAFTFGNCLSASQVAFAKNGIYDNFTPSRVRSRPSRAQQGDARHIDLNDGGQLRGDRQRLDHAGWR